MISVTVNSQITQFVYDGGGNLVKKVNPEGSRTIYVGGLYEVDKISGGTVTKTTVYYPLAGAMRVNGTLYYVLKDHLGSASVVTDSTGAVVGEQRYYPFGETRLSAGTLYTDKLFTGQREMTGLGIYHYGARFYSPKLGRFLSADTIVPNPFNPQDYNRFAYVRNNPVRYVDPSGHICVQKGGGLDEFAIAGNCNGGEKANYQNPFPGGVPAVNKPGKPKKDDGGAKDIPELSKDDDASQTPTSTTTPAPDPGETPVTSSTPMLEPPGTEPPCKDADACDTDIALLTLELVHLLAFDMLMLVLVSEAVAAGPAGWVGLALVSPVIVGFYYRTWQTIGEIREILEWRDYYNEISP